mmetsp:Transcript_61335/g.144332  ORF Transcript_61335/g.144332 Transcript_61335/m.144332 type:complete len:303 (-) Transcript_61335:709-1617(-)
MRVHGRWHRLGWLGFESSLERRLDRGEVRTRERVSFELQVAARFVDDVAEHRQVQRLPSHLELVEREALAVDVDSARHYNHLSFARSLQPWVAYHLQIRQRREQDLGFTRILRQKADRRPSVHLPDLDLQNRRQLPLSQVIDRCFPPCARRHQPELRTSSAPILVRLPESVGEPHAGKSAPDFARLREPGDLLQFEEPAGYRVDRRRVAVASQRLHVSQRHVPEHRVVLDVLRTRVQPQRDDFLFNQLGAPPALSLRLDQLDELPPCQLFPVEPGADCLNHLLKVCSVSESLVDSFHHLVIV